MTQFKFIAINKQGKTVSGDVDMNDRGSVIAALTKQGLRPVSIQSNDKTGLSKLSIGRKGKSVKSDDLVIFTRQLSAMVGAGVPLLRALSSLETHAENPALKSVLAAVIKDIEGGSPFADALEKHPKVFNDIYTNMVRAGEAAGILDDILKRLAYQQEKNASMRKKIKSAMTYPMVLMFITVVAFFGLMIFVIPQIGEITQDLGGEDAELPALTRAMLAISDAIIAYWWIVIPVLVGGIYLGIRFITKNPVGRKMFHRLVLKIPGVGKIIEKVAVARFSRTFSALMGAGVAVLEALHVTSRAVGNVMFEEALVEAAKEVKNGRTLSEVIGSNDLFPGIVAQMLLTGEETGQTDTVLVKVADFYEEEVDVAIDGMSSIIEPAMIIVMGSMVGLIAASVMMPIAGLSSSIEA